ncbi:hypothetical protein [Niallia sp. 03190]|uniref:hypothetical protein n=1 Tax=Niallia sp. 03190 TaxID=3458061 RepID=UPI004044A80F
MIQFRVIKNEWPQEPKGPRLVSEFDTDKIYKAKMIWRRSSYKNLQLQEYYLKLNAKDRGAYSGVQLVDHCYVYRKYENGLLSDHAGCLPLHWFNDFKELQQEDVHTEEIKVVEEEKTIEEIALEYTVYEQLSLF